LLLTRLTSFHRGFAYGYLGGATIPSLNLLLVTKLLTWHFDWTRCAAIAFVSGIMVGCFAVITSFLKSRPKVKFYRRKGYIAAGFRDICHRWELRRLPLTLRYLRLTSFNECIQTVIFAASAFSSRNFSLKVTRSSFEDFSVVQFVWSLGHSSLERLAYLIKTKNPILVCW
jgi:hypothetical protein